MKLQGDEDHDSGTESDEQIDNPELTPEIVMSEQRSSVSPADTGCSGGSPPPSMDTFHDPHSSEEELEVINSPKQSRPPRPVRAASVCLPEKRKWSQINSDYTNTTPFMLHHTSFGSSSGTSTGAFNTAENEENMSHYGNISPREISSPMSPYGKLHGSTPDETPIPGTEHSGSSDDEVHHLLHASMSTPVQFRTSPPLEALKPAGQLHVLSSLSSSSISNSGITTNIGAVKGRSLSPPPKLLHCELSPRKRSRHARHSHVQRPCLDFEKMQQLKARGVTAWRHNGDHGGELSVFCW
ncbi:autism susceptibility gene 2 protein isoform X2 [Chrysoperla carnea]|uniref:autism susceptibility gene 2 protein isoform X2 n=1 Tax=Chrysoperla carnea TaxID=189513 RepID=UPI001D092DAB|nr:autism susceptibility gene 2 protein isoform X2 [Chrysoperla carnea]